MKSTMKDQLYIIKYSIPSLLIVHNCRRQILIKDISEMNTVVNKDEAFLKAFHWDQNKK